VAIGVVLLAVYFGVHTGVVETAEEGATESTIIFG
jgi:hypothetical protein